MRYGMPEMKIDILRLYIAYVLQILLTGRGSTGHILLYSKRQVYYSKRVLSFAGVLRFTMAKKPVRLRRVIQH